MIARITPRPLSGEIAAIPSKSEAHRVLICAALADSPTRVNMAFTSQDIDATIRCLTAFGAKITRDDFGIDVEPIKAVPARCEADCGESGSTLRFLLPVAAALGIETDFIMHGRLPDRPIFPLDRELTRGNCVLSRPEKNILRVSGQLTAGNYELPGNVSSQYISGMLLGLSLVQGSSVLTVTGEIESIPYINMTLETMKRFGVSAPLEDHAFRVAGNKGFRGISEISIGGDWSNAAFWLCMDAARPGSIRVTGLDPDSAQGDKRITNVIAALRSGASAEFDAADAPDLVPTLAACACVLGKELRVTHAERLRLKESDRIASVANGLNALGANVEETRDGLLVRANCAMTGGIVDAAGDHRIAMMAAVASLACSQPVTVIGADAVRKSYPEFWNDFAALGGSVVIETEVTK